MSAISQLSRNQCFDLFVTSNLSVADDLGTDSIVVKRPQSTFYSAAAARSGTSFQAHSLKTLDRHLQMVGTLFYRWNYRHLFPKCLKRPCNVSPYQPLHCFAFFLCLLLEAWLPPRRLTRASLWKLCVVVLLYRNEFCLQDSTEVIFILNPAYSSI